MCTLLSFVITVVVGHAIMGHAQGFIRVVGSVYHSVMDDCLLCCRISDSLSIQVLLTAVDTTRLLASVCRPGKLPSLLQTRQRIDRLFPSSTAILVQY